MHVVRPVVAWLDMGVARMMSLREAGEDRLQWTWAPDHRLHWVLDVAGDGIDSEHVIATLQRVEGDTTQVETAEGRWTLTHRGMWVQYVDVELDTQRRGVAPFRAQRDLRQRWRLVLANGVALRWRVAGLASADWICEREAGERLMVLRVATASDYPHGAVALDSRGRPPSAGPYNMEGHVALTATVREWPETACILSLGWYLALIRASPEWY
jgi:hypothetical protein